jgi:hypothetical protein
MVVCRRLGLSNRALMWIFWQFFQSSLLVNLHYLEQGGKKKRREALPRRLFTHFSLHVVGVALLLHQPDGEVVGVRVRDGEVNGFR